MKSHFGWAGVLPGFDGCSVCGVSWELFRWRKIGVFGFSSYQSAGFRRKELLSLDTSTRIHYLHPHVISHTAALFATPPKPPLLRSSPSLLPSYHLTPPPFLTQTQTQTSPSPSPSPSPPIPPSSRQQSRNPARIVFFLFSPSPTCSQNCELGNLGFSVCRKVSNPWHRNCRAPPPNLLLNSDILDILKPSALLENQ